MDKLIIEVRANEGATRGDNPHVPWTPEQIAEDAAACHREGASLIHYHCRAADGAPDHSAERCAQTIAAIRERCDILQLPSLANRPAATAEERLANVAHGPDKPDFLAIEPGCANVDLFDHQNRKLLSDNRTFINTFADIRHFLDVSSKWGSLPYLVSFNVSWTRAALALAEAGWVPKRSLLLFVTGGPSFIAAHPGTTVGLDAHLSALPSDHSFEWLVCCHAGNLFEFAEDVVARGGHLSIGLGDHPHKDAGAPTNAELVRRAAEIGRAAGREPATVADLRSMLGK